jgi:hypothetical protein
LPLYFVLWRVRVFSPMNVRLGQLIASADSHLINI